MDESEDGGAAGCRESASTSIDAGVAVITVDRPAVRNAIGFATVDRARRGARRGAGRPTRPCS